MTAQTMLIGNRSCRIYGEPHAEYLLFQMTGEHELQGIDHEVTVIAQSSWNFLFVAVPGQRMRGRTPPSGKNSTWLWPGRWRPCRCWQNTVCPWSG